MSTLVEKKAAIAARIARLEADTERVARKLASARDAHARVEDELAKERERQGGA